MDDTTLNSISPPLTLQWDILSQEVLRVNEAQRADWKRYSEEMEECGPAFFKAWRKMATSVKWIQLKPKYIGVEPVQAQYRLQEKGVNAGADTLLH